MNAVGLKIKKDMIERLQFISQETETITHLQCIEAACKAGLRWVQLRVKGREPAEVLEMALAARAICDHYGAKLIINDRPEIAIEAGADGVHLGKLDMPVAEARKLVGDMIIGATANTIEDMEAHAASGADYIGLGPYRFTSTKKNLSPTLGLEGYERILARCRECNIRLPVVAIGGIRVEDIAGLMQAGLHAIAVSSLIARSENQQEIVEKIERELEKNQQAYAYNS